MFQWDGTKGPGLASKRTNALDHRGCLVDMIQVGTIGVHLAAHLIMTGTEHHVIAGIANYKGHASLESSVVIFAPGIGSQPNNGVNTEESRAEQFKQAEFSR